MNSHDGRLTPVAINVRAVVETNLDLLPSSERLQLNPIADGIDLDGPTANEGKRLSWKLLRFEQRVGGTFRSSLGQNLGGWLRRLRGAFGGHDWFGSGSIGRSRRCRASRSGRRFGGADGRLVATIV